MSGTSMDALDGVLLDFSSPQPQLLAALSLPLPALLRQQLLALSRPGDNEIARMGQADVELAMFSAELVRQLLAEAQLSASAIAAIGSHGQTIRHAPTASPAFTLQIGDPNTLAAQTGITTVADFRRRDMAEGGQGAPLVPPFHAWLYQRCEISRVVLNIGGMANITILPAGTTPLVSGFDTGPGNILLDSWIQHCHGLPMDRDGQWGGTGKANPQLLDRLLSDNYFQQPAPKSTGREHFNLSWLQSHLQALQCQDEEVMATLYALSVRSISEAVSRYAADCEEVVVCGGGAFNPLLMHGLQTKLAPRRLIDSAAAEPSVDPRWMEAMAFAWLARQTLSGQSGNLPSVTGARRPVILGGVYPAG
ncbi:MAG: anhydro-N-acetylmuramic acid kinase [Chromatiales bacterium]|nr:anhydro-N-acetylmuramic acid kinase [Gammaproteobacteria bacterium]MBW6477087.1 anhydro-N-acetylmuramic acid kinase [Chromatiales bacterium]